ncbi:MAG: ATPase P [Pseudomonas sp.]|uniref:HAD family hydrolase n=1 Tax=Pseudomonas sp. TaxID=306 RepID=UPI002733F550|nr:ATPase P [Pseudomonas sp.]MDP3847693.1 ATPase P [Pseudomonas sp.]
MIAIDIPGLRLFELNHLVLDYNGTLALDGVLLPGVADALSSLATQLQIHVITADTFGHAKAQLAGVPVELSIAPLQAQTDWKRQFVSDLGADGVVAIGNGRNDSKMLAAAALGIALIQREGAAAVTVASADVVCTRVFDALALLQNPKRLMATLRS